MTAPATAKRFPSPDPKVIRHGPMGIPVRGTCVVCGKSFRQPENGRPRKLCRRAKCERERRQRLRQEYEPPVWTEADREEAIRVWDGKCVYCRMPISVPPAWCLQLLPVHPRCAETRVSPPPADATSWLARVKPGCPLPSPWKGAK